jgi:S1-C subfamily serine protease
MTGDGPARSPRALATGAAAPAAQAHAAAGAPSAPRAATPQPRPADAVVISRAELDRAIADFAGLTAAVHGSFSASGVTLASVGDGTIFQRAGLRAGDVITAVDGVRLRSLDDTASLYARAATATALTAQVVRGGKPVTLHVVIQ